MYSIIPYNPRNPRNNVFQCARYFTTNAKTFTTYIPRTFIKDNGMSNSDSLTKALEDWFEKPLSDLAYELRKRVKQDFFPMCWDDLHPEQRRSIAQQWDYQHDPANDQEQELWWELYNRIDKLKQQIQEWEAVSCPTASDLSRKEDRLKDLYDELAEIEEKLQTKGRYTGNRDNDLQNAANTLAKRWKEENRKHFTKRDIAKELSTWDEWMEMTYTRIERIIRKEW